MIELLMPQGSGASHIAFRNSKRLHDAAREVVRINDTRGGDNPTNALLKLVDVPEANSPSGVLLESQRFASEASV